MLMKKLRWCLWLLCFLLAALGTGVSGSEKGQIIESTEIPEPMQPGSEILFVDSSHYKILKGGTPDKKIKESKIEDLGDSDTGNILVVQEEYPLPKKGVKVTYADDGYINRILYHGKDYEGTDHVEINHVDVGEAISKWALPYALFLINNR